MSNYKTNTISDLGEQIKNAGFRVFIANRGTYGFYTDNAGSKVVSFGIDLLRIRFSGNYKTDNPVKTGTGWVIADDSEKFNDMFNTFPPKWAVGNAKWKFTTLEEYLNTYQVSSNFNEI